MSKDMPAAFSSLLPADAALGAVELTVTDLDRALGFYADVLGLRLHGRTASTARLGDGTVESILLVEDPSARPAGRHAGLYHVALLFPSRLELARAALRIVASATPIEGASDHGTHEAIYLPDPDGNGIELAADRPAEQWPPLAELMQAGGPRPLDVPSLFTLVDGETPTPVAGDGVRVGHVHLHVNDLEAATRFYRDVLGFEVQMALPHAVFVSFGGYHHHVAFNVWRGRGIPGVPANAVGMRHFTLTLPEPARTRAVDRLRDANVLLEEVGAGSLAHDPAGNGILLASA
jgi:catechol 2,3-dioxygenase